MGQVATAGAALEELGAVAATAEMSIAGLLSAEQSALWALREFPSDTRMPARALQAQWEEPEDQVLALLAQQAVPLREEYPAQEMLS